MCGRYVFNPREGELEARYRVVEGQLQVNYNVTPGLVMPVVINEGGTRLEMMRWGLVPSWSFDESIGNRLINARSETVKEKSVFKQAYYKRRCIVPMSGFYEWKDEGNKKTVFYLTRADNKILGVAGLYEKRRKEDGKILKTYSIITTSAKGTASKIHDRMPVILSREGEKEWLNLASQSGLLEELMRDSAHELVSKRIRRIGDIP